MKDKNNKQFIPPLNFANKIWSGGFLAWFFDKLKRDNLWKITVTTASENLEEIASQLKTHDIGCTYIPITPKKGVIDIYSNTQKESAIIRDILKQYDVKYCITEVKKTL